VLFTTPSNVIPFIMPTVSVAVEVEYGTVAHVELANANGSVEDGAEPSEFCGFVYKQSICIVV